jgi:hypothetical protein
VSEPKPIRGFSDLETAYNRTLKLDLPVVNVGNVDAPVYLPPEVCQVLPAQNAKFKLSPAQTQEMIKFAVRKPNQNAMSVARQGPKPVGLNPNINVLLVRLSQHSINLLYLQYLRNSLESPPIQN